MKQYDEYMFTMVKWEKSVFVMSVIMESCHEFNLFNRERDPHLLCLTENGVFRLLSIYAVTSQMRTKAKDSWAFSPLTLF